MGIFFLAMGKIHEKDLIKILSEDKKVRLDIGGDCVLKEVPASHESWATRLIIKRLDGPNKGPVQTDHVVGIFSEDGQKRLDVGEAAMKKMDLQTMNHGQQDFISKDLGAEAMQLNTTNS